MAEGTKNLATDAQRVSEVKADHKIMALDPETGMMVFIEPGQLGEATGSNFNSDYIY